MQLSQCLNPRPEQPNAKTQYMKNVKMALKIGAVDHEEDTGKHIFG